MYDGGALLLGLLGFEDFAFKACSEPRAGLVTVLGYRIARVRKERRTTFSATLPAFGFLQFTLDYGYVLRPGVRQVLCDPALAHPQKCPQHVVTVNSAYQVANRLAKISVGEAGRSYTRSSINNHRERVQTSTDIGLA